MNLLPKTPMTPKTLKQAANAVRFALRLKKAAKDMAIHEERLMWEACDATPCYKERSYPEERDRRAINWQNGIKKAKANTMVMLAKAAAATTAMASATATATAAAKVDTATATTAVVDAGWSFDDDFAPPPCRHKSCM